MEQIIKIFIAMVRSEICNVPLEPEIVNAITPEVMEYLYRISANQDMAHIVALALKRNKLLGDDKISKKFSKSIHGALLRYEQMEYEQKRIYKVLEKEKIVFVPLKGSVIRKYYPEKWMRTSCDIDILVHEEDLKRAKKALVTYLNYKEGMRKYHDLSLYAPSGVLLELHFRITENEKHMDKYLAKVWEYVQPKSNVHYMYNMTPEYLMFHEFAHMLYHFMHGGCGVRFVADIWLLEHKLEYDEQLLQKMCKQCRIDTFVSYVRKLARVWFEGEAHDDVTRKMESYIITGGVYGNVETKVVVRKTKVKGKTEYLFQRVFIPYQEFCASYPRLEKQPYLYPYYTVKRWFKIFQKGMPEQAAYEMKLNKEIDQQRVDELSELFDKLKL